MPLTVNDEEPLYDTRARGNGDLAHPQRSHVDAAAGKPGTEQIVQ
jgi:hypothetical protein